MQKRLRDAAAALSARWEHLPTDTLHDLTCSILVRAQVHSHRIDLDIGSARLVGWLLNDSAGEGTVEGKRTSSANVHGSEEPLIRLRIRASLKRTGKEMKFIVEGVTNSAPADTTLIRLLVRGQKIANFLDRFWDELSADPSVIDEATRQHYAELYAQPHAMHDALEQFVAFPQDGIDNRAFLAQGKLTMRVLALGGEKSYGADMATELGFVASDVKGGVIPNSGHWIMEENPTATTKMIVDFLTK